MTVQSRYFFGEACHDLKFEGAGQGKQHDTAPSGVACQEPDWVEQQVPVEAAKIDFLVISSKSEAADIGLGN